MTRDLRDRSSGRYHIDALIEAPEHSRHAFIEVTMSLCQHCERFDLQSFRQDTHARRRLLFQDVLENYSTCSFCNLLWSCFDSDSKASWIHLELLTAQRERVNRGRAPLQAAFLRVVLAERPYFQFNAAQFRNIAWQEALLHVCSEEGSPAATTGDVSGRYSNTDLLSSENAVLSDWLSSCLRHDACKSSISSKRLPEPFTSPLPTRSIYVGSSEAPELHIVETAHYFGTYVTLSHRWNETTEKCSTVLQNYQGRLRRLEMDALPRTFQEAVALTRQIGVQYLWIDSLCIIQHGDDGADWNLEAQNMAEYYQNAIVTFVALDQKRLVPLQSPTHSAHDFVELPYRDIEDRRRLGSFYVYKAGALNQTYEEDVIASSLRERAWVFQETLLTRRIVWFSSTNVIFECQSVRPQNQLKEVVRMQNRAHRVDFLGHLDAPFRFHDYPRCFWQWYEIVQAYSAKKFTFPDKDRITALLGIAAELGSLLTKRADMMAERYDEQSVGHLKGFTQGLWLEHAHIGLLWQQSTYGPHTRLPSYPSWSWANLDATVLWSHSGDLQNNDRVSVNPTLESSIPAILSSTVTEISNETIEINEMTVSRPTQCLLLKACTQTVIIGRLLDPHEIAKLYQVAYRPRAVPNLIRAVHTTLPDRRLCGWACLEHEDFVPSQSTTENAIPESPSEEAPMLRAYSNNEDPMCEVIAVHVSTMRGAPDGYRAGYWLPWHSVLNVLFVRKTDFAFERLGMGSLFGKETCQSFKSNGPEDICLI